MRSNKNMSDTAHIVERARHAAVYLVEREQRAAGSRMAAYDRVGSMIGASGGWLRKFIGRSHEVRPDLVVGFNLLELYDRVCARVEQAAENERTRAAALRAEGHEATQGDLGLVDREARAAPAGTDPEE